VDKNYRLKEGKLIQTMEIDLGDMAIEVIEGVNRPKAIVCMNTVNSVDFEGDAERLLKWLFSTIPSGTMDKFYQKLHRYKLDNP
jgi:hypothetical protein